MALVLTGSDGEMVIYRTPLKRIAEQFTFFGRRVIQVNDLDKNLI